MSGFNGHEPLGDQQDTIHYNTTWRAGYSGNAEPAPEESHKKGKREKEKPLLRLKQHLTVAISSLPNLVSTP